MSRTTADRAVQAKDASAPKIEAVKVTSGAETRDSLLREVSAADWRDDLKHTQPVKDASAPRIEGTMRRQWPRGLSGAQRT